MKTFIENFRNEKTYLYFVDNYPSAIIVLEYKTGKILYVNKNTLDIYGYSYDEFMNFNINELTKGLYVQMTDMIGGKITRTQLINRIKDYSKIKIELTKHYMKYLGKEYFILIIEKLNDTLIEDEDFKFVDLYIKAFEEAPSGVILLSDEFQILKWNKASEGIFGYSYSDVLNKNIVDFVAYNEQKNKLEMVLNNSLKYDSVDIVLENTSKENNNIICRWHVKSIYDFSNKTYQFICIVNNITESIRKSRELMKINKAMDQSESIVIITDVEGIFEYVNDKFEKTTGYLKDEIIGKNINILSSGKHSKLFYNEIWNTIKSGNSWTGELYNKKKDESYYWCQNNIYPVIENDVINSYVCIQQDITLQKKLETLNQNLKNKLIEQDKIASLGLLTTGILHEINNPLSYIQTNTTYLINLLENVDKIENDDIDDAKEALIDIDTGLNQIKNIASGLKKYIFKRENDELEIVDLIEVIDTVSIISKNEYKYHAKIVLDYDKNLEYNVFGHASKLKQVFLNLIINATHAIIAAENDDFGLIRICFKLEKNLVIVEVIDNGCGMDEITLSKIFEPFYTTKEKGVGSGLGLSITKQIIENDHNGQLICQSEIGKGTSFIIKLPKE